MLRGSCVVCLVAVLATVWGAPAGVPNSFSTTPGPLAATHNQTVLSSVCRSMIPQHSNHQPQSTLAPYKILVSHKTAAPGDTIQVRIYGENLHEFRGVYIQGRDGETPVGEFIQPGPESPPVRLTDCVPGVKNAASYISRQPITELSLRYVVPNVPTIIFRATIVRSFSEFWTNVISEPVAVSATSL